MKEIDDLSAALDAATDRIRKMPAPYAGVRVGNGEWQYTCDLCRTRWIGFASEKESARFSAQHYDGESNCPAIRARQTEGM